VRTSRVLAALLLCAAASLRAGAAEGDLVLEAVPEQKSVKLGEDAVLVLTLTNHTATAMKVPVLRLARDSISVRVMAPGGGGGTVTRLYGSFLENDTGGLDFRAAVTPMRKLDAGASVQARIVIPALLTGDLSFTAVLGDGGGSPVAAKSAVVDVQGRQHVSAQVDTTKGSFQIDLDAAGAYSSVASFWTLANEHFYDNLPFHRVVLGALAQTGDPRGNGTGGPGWYLPAEPRVGAATRGDVGLARGTHADSAGSQWFVVADAKGVLPGGYVRLGTVSAGLDTLDQLAANAPEPKTERPKTPDRVVSVRTLLK